MICRLIKNYNSSSSCSANLNHSVCCSVDSCSSPPMCPQRVELGAQSKANMHAFSDLCTLVWTWPQFPAGWKANFTLMPIVDTICVCVCACVRACVPGEEGRHLNYLRLNCRTQPSGEIEGVSLLPPRQLSNLEKASSATHTHIHTRSHGGMYESCVHPLCFPARPMRSVASSKHKDLWR